MHLLMDCWIRWWERFLAGKVKTGRLYLGIDTSAYTTSMALVNEEEELHWEKRLFLPVKKGNIGLRQSEAVFAHLNNLPLLWEEGSREAGELKLAGVASSTCPRPVEGSYMPVFKVSEAFGRFLAQTKGLLFLPFSHQEGHIVSGMWSAGITGGPYLVLHISGGTTEILAVSETKPGRLSIKLLGGTEDLNAGQFVDRIGAELGLSFPAGPELEKLALSGSGKEIKLPVAVRGTRISFSGPASHAGRLLGNGCPAPALARAVEECLAESLARAAAHALQEGSYRGALVVGGVTANDYIRRRLNKLLYGHQLYFASPSLAGDNAVGLAVQLSRRQKIF